MVTDNSSGEMFCGNCGFVLTERIEEMGPEWRAFSKEEHEDRSRAGIPTSLAMHDMGLADYHRTSRQGRIWKAFVCIYEEHN